MQEETPRKTWVRKSIGTLDHREDSGSKSWAKHRWHSLDAIRYPDDPAIFEGDLGGLIRDWVLTGHKPDAGTLGFNDTVVTLGSCFAQNLRKYLTKAGVLARNFTFPSGLNNTFAIADFISWVVTGNDTGRGYRYDSGEHGEIEEWTPEAERLEYEEALRTADAFVFTLGLAEVWEDRDTGGVFWRGVPEGIFDEGRHVFRLSSVEENEENIVRIVELVRTIAPDAPIVLTLSPVPLKATFRDISCMSADVVSKATLRLAIDRVMGRKLPGVWYWPSFEVVRWVGGHVPYPVFGTDGNARHVDQQIVAAILDAFIEAFWTPDAAAELRAKAAS